MNNQGIPERNEIIAVLAASAAEIWSLVLWYFEHAEVLETDELIMAMDEDTKLDNITKGMDASSKQSASSAHSKLYVNKPCPINRIAETISSMVANAGKIAKAVAESSDNPSIDKLYEEVMKIKGLDDESLVGHFFHYMKGSENFGCWSIHTTENVKTFVDTFLS